ncbi:MAG: hypothetical protein NW216_03640 [Hyphomicrobium sp.]|nr:hypothetical protein [Hyphomicrobium sp.]
MTLDALLPLLLVAAIAGYFGYRLGYASAKSELAPHAVEGSERPVVAADAGTMTRPTTPTERRGAPPPASAGGGAAADTARTGQPPRRTSKPPPAAAGLMGGEGK